jgi:hypothetical protein
VRGVGGEAPQPIERRLDWGERTSRQHVAARSGERDDERKTEDEDDEHLPELLLHVRLGVQLAIGGARMVLQLLVELVPNGKERHRGVDGHHQKQHGRVPGGETGTNRGARPAAHHGSPSRRTNPTPRTV